MMITMQMNSHPSLSQRNIKNDIQMINNIIDAVGIELKNGNLEKPINDILKIAQKIAVNILKDN